MDDFDLDAVTHIAVALGIDLTEAEEGSGYFEQWAARVLQAQLHADRGEADRLVAMIAQANLYAVNSTRSLGVDLRVGRGKRRKEQETKRRWPRPLLKKPS
jgi:hypothetical protein